MLTKQDDEFTIDTENIVDNNPSIHKPLYYMKSPLNAQKIVEHPDFQRFLKATIKKQEQELLKKQRDEYELNKEDDAQTIQLRSELNNEEQELLEEIEVISKKINKSVQKSAIAMRKTIESVIQIRKHYLRMIESQEKVSTVNLTPQLNLDLLNLEESMIDSGLLSISEVKDPSQILDTHRNREHVAKIVTTLIGEQNEGFLSYFDNLIQAQPSLMQDIENKINVPETQVNFFPVYTHAQFGEALLAITEYAHFKNPEKKGKTFLNEKWADFFPEVDEADKIFFINFLESQKLFKELAITVLEVTKNEKDVNAFGRYAAVFANVGLIDVSKQLISRVSSLDGLKGDAAKHVLRICSEFPDQFGSLSDRVIEQANKLTDISSTDSIDLVYYQIALDKINETSVKTLQKNVKHIIEENPRLNYVNQYLKLKGIDLGHNGSGASLFEDNLFKINPIKEKLVDLIGRIQNLTHTSLGNLKPDFMCLDRNEKGDILQKAIFITPAEHSYFDTPKSSVEYTLLAKYLNHKVKNMVFEFIPITKFIDINHDTNQITIKRDNQIFIDLLDLTHKNLYADLNENLVKLGEDLLSEEYNILKSKMKQIFRLSSGRRYLQLSISDLMQVKYLLYSMAEDFKTVLPESNQKQLNELSQKHFKKDFVTLLKDHCKIDLNVNSTQEELEFFLKQKWVGKRLTIDLLPKGNEKYSNEDAFFDHLYISSENYYEYPEWQEILSSEYGVSNISQVNPTTLISHQVSDACNNTNSTYIIPKKREVRSQIRPFENQSYYKNRETYNLNWNKFYIKEGNQEEPTYQGENTKVSENSKYIANLLNFKWELKKAMNSSQRLNVLHKLNFTDKLIENHLNNNSNQVQANANYATRTASKYFEYLENKTPSSLYCQEYLEFFTRKADQKNKIVKLSKLHFTRIQEIYKSYQSGYISREQFLQQKEAIQKDLLKTLKQYDAANTSLDVLLQNQSDRFIDVQYDVESLLKDKSFVRYSLESDRDYALSGKDLNQCLNLKRVKAEEKLIKAKILSKVSADKKLTKLEQQYLEKWSNNELNLPKNHTFMTFKDLDAKDVESLNSLKFSEVASFKNMQVNDLVLEFAGIFEQAIISNADVHLKGKTAFKEWGISPEFISKSATNSMNNYLIALGETQAWREGQQLNDHEKGNIRTILKILKEQSYDDKIITPREDLLRQEALEVFNLSENRFEIFLKWLESRENECFSVVPDNTEQVYELWQKIFSKSYDKTNEDELHLFIHNLVQRLFVLSKYPPAAFGSFLSRLLIHPKLNIIDKNILICGLDAFKFNAYLNSRELIEFSRNVRRVHAPKDLADLTRANIYTTENILQKISKLVKN